MKISDTGTPSAISCQTSALRHSRLYELSAIRPQRWRSFAGLQLLQQPLTLDPVLVILGTPAWLPGRGDEFLQNGLRLRVSLGCDQNFGEEVERGGVLWAVGERSPQVLFGFGVASAEQAWNLVVPPAERAIRGSLLERGIQSQGRHQLVANFPAILDALSQAVGFGEAAHVGGNPEMSLGTIGLESHRSTPRRNPAFEEGTPFFVGGVAAQPVVRARQLGGGIEVFRILAQARFPDLGRLLRTREVGAVGIERVGIVRSRLGHG